MSMFRLPAPLMPFVWVARPVIRKAKERRSAAKQHAKVAAMVISHIPKVDASSSDAVESKMTARQWLYRHRRDTVAATATAFLLACTRSLIAALGQSQIPLAASVLLLALAGAWWVRRIDVTLHARAAMVTVALALLWLVWGDDWRIWTGVPAHVWRWAALAVATSVACAARWRRFAPRRVIVEIPEETLEEKWLRTQGADARPLAGTALRDVARVISPDGRDVGWTSFVVCVDGKHTTSTVEGQKENIAGSFGRDKKDVQVERTGNTLLPRLAVLERDPFPPALTWNGPSFSEVGVSRLGSYYDGMEAGVRLHKPGAGTFDTWCIGKKGSGKSTTVDCLLGNWMSAGRVVGDLTDMKGGTSLPHWGEQMLRYGKDSAAGMLGLQRACAVLDARTAEMSQMVWHAEGDPEPRTGISCLEPSVEWPVYLLILEEGPQLLRNPAALPLLEKVMTLGRAACVAVLYVSQMAELRQAFGNSSTIREQLQGGNVWAGYIGSSQANLGFDDFKPDLSALEKDSYLSYLTSPVQSREAVMRVDYIQDGWAVARASKPGTPNPIDLAAIREVEERLERNNGMEVPGQPSVATREDVEAAVKRLCDESGAPVATGDVVRSLGDPKDETHYERVRKALKTLGEDPASRVQSPAWGKWAS